MKVLITGTSGFVGGNLSSTMKQKKISVVSAGRNKNSDIICDFLKPESLFNLNLRDFDVVIHCAGPIDEDFKKSKKKSFIHAKEGTKALVERVKFFKVKNYIHFSTAHVYGELTGNLDEDKTPKPITDYSRAHLFAEDVVLKKLKDSVTNFCILRPLTIYDIPVEPLKFKRWHLIPYSFPAELFSKKKLILKSSGQQYRNFVSMKSISLFLINFLIEKKIRKFQKINLVGSNTMRVIDFANLCQKTIKKKYNFLPTINKLTNKENELINQKLIFSSKFDLKDDKERIKKFVIDLIETRTNKNFKNLWQNQKI